MVRKPEGSKTVVGQYKGYARSTNVMTPDELGLPAYIHCFEGRCNLLHEVLVGRPSYLEYKIPTSIDVPGTPTTG